jgi:hypothetical protein
MKGKARTGDDHLTPNIVRMPMCMCICLCNLISNSIVLECFVHVRSGCVGLYEGIAN